MTRLLDRLVFRTVVVVALLLAVVYLLAVVMPAVAVPDGRLTERGEVRHSFAVKKHDPALPGRRPLLITARQVSLSRSVSRYRVDWRRRYLAEHRHVHRLLARLRARTVQAHAATDWRAKQIAAAEVLGREGDAAGTDPWPNCPDPYDHGGASWDDTVRCENPDYGWVDSPGFYRCGLQFDPMWESRFGRLCP